MRSTTLALFFAAAAALAACGGSSDDSPAPPPAPVAPVTTTPRPLAWSVAPSPAAAALADPGSGSATADGRSVSLVGGNSGTTGCSGGQFGFTTAPCTVVASAGGVPGTYAFDWTYTTADTSGPGADIFGVIVDGRVVPLSDPGGAMQQSGRMEVTAMSSVAFFVNCTDCTDGAARATVSGFAAK